MDPLPPLNPLKMFEATARLMSVSKAAEQLCVTPSAVSRQIRTLEAFLGVALFSRVRGAIELTPAGARYLADIAPLMAALRASTNAVMGGSYRRQALKIRSPATFAVRWLIPRLASFHREHPDVDVLLTTSQAPLDFDREDIDGGVELGDGAWPRLHVQSLVRNELVPVVAPQRPGGQAVPTTPRQLANDTLLHSLARPDDWALWLEAAGVTGINAYRGMKYETSLLSYQAALEGHGLAVAQKALIEKELQDGTLVAPFDVVLDRGDHTYYFASPADRTGSRALVAFRSWLTALMQGARPADPLTKTQKGRR